MQDPQQLPPTPTVNKVYSGLRIADSASDNTTPVSVTNTDTDETILLDPAASLRVVNHSPDGFEWGYAGSGPAQLALAILLDHFAEDIDNAALVAKRGYLHDSTPSFALQFYQEFKFRHVAHWGLKWEITTQQITATINELVTARAKAVGK